MEKVILDLGPVRNLDRVLKYLSVNKPTDKIRSANLYLHLNPSLIRTGNLVYVFEYFGSMSEVGSSINRKSGNVEGGYFDGDLYGEVSINSIKLYLALDPGENGWVLDFVDSSYETTITAVKSGSGKEKILGLKKELKGDLGYLSFEELGSDLGGVVVIYSPLLGEKVPGNSGYSHTAFFDTLLTLDSNSNPLKNYVFVLYHEIDFYDGCVVDNPDVLRFYVNEGSNRKECGLFLGYKFSDNDSSKDWFSKKNELKPEIREQMNQIVTDLIYSVLKKLKEGSNNTSFNLLGYVAIGEQSDFNLTEYSYHLPSKKEPGKYNIFTLFRLWKDSDRGKSFYDIRKEVIPKKMLKQVEDLENILFPSGENNVLKCSSNVKPKVLEKYLVDSLNCFKAGSFLVPRDFVLPHDYVDAHFRLFVFDETKKEEKKESSKG